MLGARAFQDEDIGRIWISEVNGSTRWPRAYDADVPKMSVGRGDGAPHPHRATIGQNAGRDTRHPAKLPIKREPPLSFRSDGMPPLFPRTMEDVDDAEEAELRRLEGRTPGGMAPSPSTA